MKRFRSICLRGMACSLLLMLAFAAGWLTSVYGSNEPKRKVIQLNAGGVIVVPPGYGLALVSRDVTNQGFVPGDRIDAMVKHEGKWRTLVIDALVAREDWQMVALIVRQEDVPLFVKANSRGITLKYRKTLAPE